MAPDTSGEPERAAGRPATLAEIIEAGLYDPAHPDGAAHLEVIEHLLEAGATLSEMRAARETTGWIATAVADRTLFGLGERLPAAELARRCDMPLEQLLRVRLASGLPTDESTPIPSWVEEDLAGFKAASALFGEEPTLAFTRVMGAAAAKIAEAELALFIAEVETALTAAAASPLAWAEANERAAALVGVSIEILAHLLREHLALAIPRQRATLADAGAGPVASAVPVGFVDLVGSTAWARSVSLRDQVHALARFESAAWEIATRRSGRVVKLIGDEAMFTSTDADSACRIALELCDAAGADPDLPPARGAVGIGAVAFRDGDYFGPLVNLVARAVKEVSAGEVAVTTPVRDACAAAGSHLRFGELGRRELRGIEELVPLLVVKP